MVSPTKPLLSLTAAELMSQTLVVIPEEMSLKGAAHLLAQAAVTGAPVVDRQGRCVGVLSSTDFVHWMDRENREVAACAASPAFWASWQIVDTDKLPDSTVRDYMTRDPVMVVAAATLGELTRKMLDVHIHRVIVTDCTNKPIGIVSSTDVLAALVRADQARGTACPAEEGLETVTC
jgi:predicted transcriptional regulator